jgi:hypothetical protein
MRLLDNPRGPHPSDWATALIALVQRLRAVPGAGPAAERITALAAVALGDAELNALLAHELARKKN